MKVLVVDDQRLFREMLTAVLSLEDGVEVREARDGAEALCLAGVWRPDVVLLDLEMPVHDGLHVAEQIRRRSPHARVVVLTGCNQQHLVLRAVQVGACGYLLKDVSPERVVESVWQAYRGQSPLDPRMAAHLLSHLACRGGGSAAPDRSAQLRLLSKRELDIVRLIGRNLSNREIARHLFLSENTVKVHVSNILRKLDLGDRIAIALLAARCGLADEEQTVQAG